jgi:hypothetical protein
MRSIEHPGIVKFKIITIDFVPLPRVLKSSYAQTSALMKPLSKSEWMTPAASGAQAPVGTVQHLTSVSPAVKKYCSRKSKYILPSYTSISEKSKLS